MATIAIFNFTGTWNSYLVPSTFISTQDKYVLVVGLQTVNNAHFQQENLTLAGIPFGIPCDYFLHVYTEVFRSGNCHLRNKKLMSGL